MKLFRAGLFHRGHILVFLAFSPWTFPSMVRAEPPRVSEIERCARELLEFSGTWNLRVDEKIGMDRDGPVFFDLILGFPPNPTERGFAVIQGEEIQFYKMPGLHEGLKVSRTELQITQGGEPFTHAQYGVEFEFGGKMQRVVIDEPPQKGKQRVRTRYRDMSSGAAADGQYELSQNPPESMKKNALSSMMITPFSTIRERPRPLKDKEHLQFRIQATRVLESYLAVLDQVQKNQAEYDAKALLHLKRTKSQPPRCTGIAGKIK